VFIDIDTRHEAVPVHSARTVIAGKSLHVLVTIQGIEVCHHVLFIGRKGHHDWSQPSIASQVPLENEGGKVGLSDEQYKPVKHVLQWHQLVPGK
jgi:hypothetical protein